MKIVNAAPILMPAILLKFLGMTGIEKDGVCINSAARGLKHIITVRLYSSEMWDQGPGPWVPGTPVLVAPRVGWALMSPYIHSPG